VLAYFLDYTRAFGSGGGGGGVLGHEHEKVGADGRW